LFSVFLHLCAFAVKQFSVFLSFLSFLHLCAFVVKQFSVFFFLLSSFFSYPLRLLPFGNAQGKLSSA
jgi:hypothetical protein